MSLDTPVIKPQPGFQEEVLSCEADVAIIGGAAGAGKTFVLLMEALRNVEDPAFAAVIFRRTKEMIRATGGLWDESAKLFPQFGGEPSQSILKWRFPNLEDSNKPGATIDFEGIEYEKDLGNWQGAQIPLIIFDELAGENGFTEKMFQFMFSRNRGICSIKPYIRASCNPDPDSWVANFISWYIDQDTGYPIKERCGVIRYVTSYKDRWIWGDTRAEVVAKCPEMFTDEKFLASGINPEDLIKSFTFIPGDIYDNKILLQHDPGYLGSLSSMDDADQDRFLRGNWKVRSDGMGLYDYNAIERIFKNAEDFEENDPVLIGWVKTKPIYVDPSDYRNNYITCDAAKFGRDLCVICVWKGFKIIHISIFFESSPHDIYREIESLRMEFKVAKTNVCVDQDGVGGDTVRLGKYYGFRARAEVAEDPDSRVKENYKMRKDQCFFRSANRVNEGNLKISLVSVKIWDKGSKNPRYSRKLKWKGEMVDVETLIKNQLRAIKKGLADFEGGTLKLCTNTKDEQKLILDGDSPDFADNIMMREEFVLLRRRRGGVKVY